MRIRNKQRTENLISSTKNVGLQKITGSTEPEFSDVLQTYHSFDDQKGLTELLDKLDECGQRLAKSFSIYDLKAYQDTLRGFLRETSGKAYEIKEQMGLSSHGKTKIFQRVELINRELEELSKLVLAKQKEPLKILKKLDYIRGLVIDLYS